MSYRTSRYDTGTSHKKLILSCLLRSGSGLRRPDPDPTKRVRIRLDPIGSANPGNISNIILNRNLTCTGYLSVYVIRPILDPVSGQIPNYDWSYIRPNTIYLK
jgi:hypothetical protein